MTVLTNKRTRLSISHNLGAPEDSFRGLSKDEIDEQLLRSFLATGKVVIEQNIPLLTSGAKGFCSKAELGRSKCLGRIPVVFKPACKQRELIQGRLTPSLYSHPHPDHIDGICTNGGLPLFPNAQICLSENHVNFWTDEKLLGTHLDLSVQIARDNLLPVRERIVFFKDGQEFLTGVQAMFTSGHTKEHACFILTSGNQSMCLIGNLSHHPVLLLERPRSQFIDDLDPLQQRRG